MSETVLISGGELVRPDGVERGDVLVRDGVITEIGMNLAAPAGATVINADGAWVGPGFVDLHTHLREPGKEEAETIETGANAAALGGFSAVIAMPNTEPAIDSVVAATYVLAQGQRACVDVLTAGAITIGRQGEKLAPMAEMAAIGVRVFTDDGTGVQNPLVMRRALEYARTLNITLAQHCEDEQLAAGGVMNESALSGRLGLAGRPALAEELMVMRDIELVRLTGSSVHFLHLSTARSLALVSAAKASGLRVTCEVAPHHFSLDEESCAGFDALYKVHPPLRSADDVAHLRAALSTGAIDAVATDHAPHAEQQKDLPFDVAPPGMLGLEHVAALTNEALGENPVELFGLLSRRPARIARISKTDASPVSSAHGGDLVVGEDANLVVFDPWAKRIVDRERLASRSTNTPYHGRELRGATRATVIRGSVVVSEGERR